MTYKVNGTELILQPTQGRWMPRQMLGVDGNGHPVYAGTREFQLSWGVISPSEFNQLTGFFDAVVTTGTAVVDLPEFGASTYTFKSYSGCNLYEPEVRQYFSEHQLDTMLLITNIP